MTRFMVAHQAAGAMVEHQAAVAMVEEEATVVAVMVMEAAVAPAMEEEVTGRLTPERGVGQLRLAGRTWEQCQHRRPIGGLCQTPAVRPQAGEVWERLGRHIGKIARIRPSSCFFPRP